MNKIIFFIWFLYLLKLLKVFIVIGLDEKILILKN